MVTFLQFCERIKEDVGGGVPVNNVGAGKVAGLGVGPQGEPGVTKKNKNKYVLGTIRRLKENAPANSIAGGGIASMGGLSGDPGVKSGTKGAKTSSTTKSDADTNLGDKEQYDYNKFFNKIKQPINVVN